MAPAEGLWFWAFRPETGVVGGCVLLLLHSAVVTLLIIEQLVIRHGKV